MTQETKILGGIIGASLVILFGAVIFLSNQAGPANPAILSKSDQKLLVRGDSNKTGTPSAKVTLVEFGDYQCPACGSAFPAIKQITDSYKDKILFVFRNFPLPMHANAENAAEAAEAAGAQGKYWEMHDLLYLNQAEWADASNPTTLFIKYATSLNLNIDKFKSDIVDTAFFSKIQEDLKDGNSLGVNSTPTFYLNGEKEVGLASYEDLKTKIDKLLK